MENKAEPAEASDEFLKALAENLKVEEDVDVGLAEILNAHILKAKPAQNAIAQAKDAILQLAAARASPPQPEQTDG